MNEVCGAASRSDVSVHVDLPDRPVIADLCADYFSKIVGHVLRNAFQSAEKSIEVTLEGPADSGGDRFLRVDVQDDGAGINREEQTKGFGSFYATGATAAGNLGLSVARNLALRVGAEISVKSAVGRWTKFTVLFPLQEAGGQSVPNESAPDRMRQQPATASDKQTHRPHVLLVESHADFADFLLRHLAANYAIKCVGAGGEALDQLHSRCFSAVVSSVVLDGCMDGIGLCEAIRADSSLDHIPVILVSVGSSSEEKARGLRAGADAFLEKPVSVDHLDLQIRSLIDLRNQLRLKFSKMPYLPLDEEAVPSGSRFMAQVNQYIMDNISDSNLTVEDIAEAVHVSRTLFFSRIKSLTGTTPNEFLRSMRLKVAAELLASSNNLRVTEICYMVGFTSTSYFAKCFRMQFGILPTEYVERHCRE